MNALNLLYLTSYLLGSIPFGLLIGKSRGVDIRKLGSGNIGATNVFRTLGKPWGLLCFALDFAKGLTATVLPQLLPEGLAAEQLQSLALQAGALAILGHNFPVWLRFKGGKGIATSAGVLAGVVPGAFAAALLTWILSMALCRIVSLSSILAALAVAVSGWWCYSDRPLTAGILTALAMIAVFRHRSNIQRLLRGEEHRFQFRKKPTNKAPVEP